MSLTDGPVFRKVDLIRALAAECYEDEDPYPFIRHYPGGLGYFDGVIAIEPGDDALCDRNVYVDALGERVAITPYGEVGSWPVHDKVLHHELLCIVAHAIRTVISDQEAIYVEAQDHSQLAEYKEREYIFARPPGYGEGKYQ